MTQTEAYKKAKKRVEAILGFFIHLAVYLIVNLFLILNNLFHAGEVNWSIYPLVGWGIGLAFHGLGVFVFSGLNGIKEKMIEKEMSKSV